MVQYSKLTNGIHFSYETDPNYVSFSFWEKLGKNLGTIDCKKTLKDYAEVCAEFLNK